MTFQPILPVGGYAGWAFLTRTLDRQQQAFNQSPAVARSTDYFRENIARARTPEDLVGDRQLLSVALGAFGLDDDINARAFIREVLAGGTIKEGALASRLADKRYAAFAFAFGYGNLGARTGLPGFADDIVSRYEARQFERAVGNSNGAMRQALSLEASLADVLAQSKSANAQWFAVIGNLPLRQVFETALGLPRSFGALDIDQQLTAFKERSQSVFGTDRVADFSDPDKREELIRLFLVRSDPGVAGAGFSAAGIALALLQGAG